MATIRKVGKKGNEKWYARFRAGGKELQRSTGVAINQPGMTPATAKRHALSVANSLEAVAKGEISKFAAIAAIEAITSTGSPSVLDYFSSFVPSGKAQNISNAKRAHSLFLSFMGSRAGITPLSRVTRKEAQDFIDQELIRVSSGTVSTLKAHISAVFNEAWRDGVISRNPFTGVKIEKSAQDMLKREPFTLEDMNVILTKFPEPWGTLAALSYYTGGQRIGDCVCMSWNQVDLNEGLITLATGKTGKLLHIPIIAVLLERLKLLPRDGDYLFPALRQKYTRSSGSVSVEFTALLRAFSIVGLPDKVAKGDRKQISKKSFHSIRHTVVSLLRSSNKVSPDLARAIVGHDSEEVERAYFTASMDDKRKGLDLLSN